MLVFTGFIIFYACQGSAHSVYKSRYVENLWVIGTVYLMKYPVKVRGLLDSCEVAL